ncbi:MAG: acyl-CoA dehydrogenase [Planctomycetota bacterium]|nr:MAG: acyl-CoA dehydrogenase [Planctomycetota bacterium]
MDFALTEEQRLIQQTARQFADEVIAPRARELDATATAPTEFFPQLAELGFMGIIIPEAYGGSGLSNLEQVLIMEELHRACASTGVTVSVHNSLVAGPIVKFGTEEQKRRYLPRMARAELIGAYCLSEPDYGSDAAGLRCQARFEGDHWVLDGTKAWITNGEIADLFIVFATEDPARRTRGISAFLVERDSPGLEVAKKEDKLGIRASCTNMVHLENVRVPADNLLGERGRGFTIAMDTLDGGRIGIATQAVGIAQACLDRSVKYARERKQFGTEIANFQAIQWKLADMATEIEAARLLTYQAAVLRDEGKPMGAKASMAKLFASETANRAAREAVQIHGGWGYVAEFDVERHYRDAKITEIYEGTSEIQRIVISRALLR